MKTLDLNEVKIDFVKDRGGKKDWEIVKGFLMFTLNQAVPKGLDLISLREWVKILDKFEEAKDGEIELSEEQFKRVVETYKTAPFELSMGKISVAVADYLEKISKV